MQVDIRSIISTLVSIITGGGGGVLVVFGAAVGALRIVSGVTTSTRGDSTFFQNVA